MRVVAHVVSVFRGVTIAQARLGASRCVQRCSSPVLRRCPPMRTRRCLTKLRYASGDQMHLSGSQLNFESLGCLQIVVPASGLWAL